MPVKITRFAKTSDNTKLVVNDITSITSPKSLECTFQFSDDISDQTIISLDKLDEAPEDKLTVLCKLLKLQETKIVGQAKYTVANAIR